MKPSIPRDLYINSAVKNVYFFNVRNIEGQSPSEHTVDNYAQFENLNRNPALYTRGHDK